MLLSILLPMSKLDKVLISSSAFVCALALFLSIYPGLLNNFLFFVMFFLIFTVPPCLLGFAAFLVYQCRRRNFDADEIVLRFWRPVGIILCLLCCTYVSLKFYLPRRIAFECCRSSFQKMVEGENRDSIGPYSIDAHATDENGGHYFRVYSGGDGIGPDVTSYGFCFKPNQHQSPFGSAGYKIFRLGDDWYWFLASGDS